MVFTSLQAPSPTRRSVGVRTRGKDRLLAAGCGIACAPCQASKCAAHVPGFVTYSLTFGEASVLKWRMTKHQVEDDGEEGLLVCAQVSLTPPPAALSCPKTFLSPLAPPPLQCYGGHQFGSWAGQLGDGRAITLGEVVNSQGQRWELQLKVWGKCGGSVGGGLMAALQSAAAVLVTDARAGTLLLPVQGLG